LPVAAILLALPLIIAIVSLIGYHWHPASDLALEVLRIRDVGGHHTPLVGAQSRFGWDHPGPLMFWLFAPFNWLLGQTGLLAGTALFNAAALVGSLLVARRRGGPALVALVAIVGALLTHALGPDLLIEPWNPWVPVLPFLLFVMLAWSVAEQDWPTLPWLVGIGSFVVQTHVGYAPVTVGLFAIACALGAYGARRSRHRAGKSDNVTAEPPRMSPRRWVVIAAVVGVLVWLAPVIQQLTGSPGNLGDIVDSFRHPKESLAGWDVGFGVMGRQLGFVGPWITGDDAGRTGLIGTASTLPAIIILAATAALGWLAWRRGARDAGRLAVLAVAGAALGVVAVSRIQGFLGPYLVRWSWILAALVWLSLAWSLWRVLAPVTTTNALVAVSLVAVLGLTVSTGWNAVSVQAPQHVFSDTIAKLGPRTDAHLQQDKRYQLTFVDFENLGAVGVGMFLDLTERGQSVRMEPGLSHAVGSWRAARRSQVDEVLTVVAGSYIERGWTPPEGATRITLYDPLTPRERARAQRLERQVRERLGTAAPRDSLPVLSAIGRLQLVADGADKRSVDELWHLRERGDAYSVYLSPAS
jgi:DNA-binding transcriptional regulator of glucitol operon